MSIEDAIKLIRSKYEENKDKKWVQKPVAYTLYEVWKIADSQVVYHPSEPPKEECQPYQPKLPRNYKPDEDSMRRRDKLFSDIEQIGIKHNPDGSMEVAFKPKEGHNE